ncbi:MAG: hypothetical protein MJ025_05420, partial [Victivallaceae bacterium]|nr:hypothetical protein [Victivallaceae bacterium]
MKTVSGKMYMAEKHMSFEERMTTRCGAEALAEAKHLLKKGALLGVWRDSNGRLAGRFRVGDGMLSCTADTSGDGFSVCDCGDDSHPLCQHGAALIMYHGAVAQRRRLMQESPPEYYGGLRREDFAQLASRCRQPIAWLEIEAPGALPHAPTKWEDFSIQVTIHAASGRTYSGNHSNMQRLFYDHILNAAVKLEDLSLQEQQIVRFLAVNSEAATSRLAMNSETFSEFFHVLVGFQRFYRGTRQIIVRRETAAPVMILNRGKVMPGLLVDGAAFPVSQATIIAGKGGCWIG